MRKTLAIELGKLGVTADAIAPGFISTAMTEATAVALGICFEELTQRLPTRNTGRSASLKISRTRIAENGNSIVDRAPDSYYGHRGLLPMLETKWSVQDEGVGKLRPAQ